MTTRTYHKTYNLIVAVEADSQAEAQRLTAELAEEVRSVLPVGARVGTLQHAAKLGRGSQF